MGIVCVAPSVLSMGLTPLPNNELLPRNLPLGLMRMYLKQLHVAIEKKTATSFKLLPWRFDVGAVVESRGWFILHNHSLCRHVTRPEDSGEDATWCTFF